MNPSDRDGKWNGIVEGRAEATERAVAASREDALRFAEAAGLSSGARARLLVVVDEIVSNVLTHGTPPAGSSIAWRLAEEDGGIRLLLTDAGKHFDPRGKVAALPEDDAEAVALASERGGGLGWRLVLAWCDIAACENVGGTNRLELVMRTG